MSHESAKILYQATQEAEQKFDYFLTGAIGAMFAYTVQNYVPKRLDLTPSTLEPVAIVCLAAAFFCGLKRIECLFHHLGNNYERNQALGDAKVMEEAVRLIESDPLKYQPRSGVSIEGIQKDYEFHRSRARSAEALLDSWNTKVRSFYVWRNCLMYAGFSILVLARVMSPYSNIPKPPTQQSAPQTAPVQQSPTKSSPPSPKE